MLDTFSFQQIYCSGMPQYLRHKWEPWISLVELICLIHWNLQWHAHYEVLLLIFLLLFVVKVDLFNMQLKRVNGEVLGGCNLKLLIHKLLKWDKNNCHPSSWHPIRQGCCWSNINLSNKDFPFSSSSCWFASIICMS